MIPYYDTAPRFHTPWVTWGLIVSNVAVFLYTHLLSGYGLIYFLNLHGVVPCRYTAMACLTPFRFPSGDYTPFISSLFIHENALHLILNQWLLWICGDNVEDRMGGVRFLAFYLLCGVLAGAFFVSVNPSSNTPTIGASGAIAGIMGAYYFLFPRARVVLWMFFLPIFLPVPAIAMLQLWVIYQMYEATTAVVGAQPSIGWWAHVGGFAAGMLIHRPFLLASRTAEHERAAESDDPRNSHTG